MKEAETINQLDNIQINFEPAKVAFSDFGAFEAGIEQAIAKYGTFDLEVNTIEEVKQARTDLNKLSENLLVWLSGLIWASVIAFRSRKDKR